MRMVGGPKRRLLIGCDNERVTPHTIIRAHSDATQARITALGEDRIPIAHDRAALNDTTHHAAEGTGAMGASGLRGFFVHSAQAIAIHGVPLGLFAPQGMFRPIPDPAPTEDEEAPTRHATRRPPPNERESRRWMDVLTARTRTLPLHERAISMANREADVYDFLAMGINQKLDLLIRAVHDRRLDQAGNPQLRETVEATAPLGSVTVDIPRSAARASYRATFELRACRVMLCPP